MPKVRSTQIGGRNVWYRNGDVLAVGEDAKIFAAHQAGVDPDDPTFVFQLFDEPPEPDDQVFLIRGEFESLDAVHVARADRMRVQLNHVLLTHCDDERCRDDWQEDFHADGTVPQANPLKATPLKATGNTADPIPNGGLHLLPDVDARDVRANIWVLDTGLAAQGVGSPLSASGLTGGDRTDVLDKVGDGDFYVDPVASHGTFIAGIIRRLEPHCTIEVRDVMDERGRVEEQALLIVLDEVFRAADDATIVNLSFGGALDDPLNTVLRDAIVRLQRAGAVVVASAGNDASCRPTYPAAFDGVISVAAVDSNGTPAPFSNLGPWVRANALGVNIASTFLMAPQGAPADLARFQSGWAAWSGTSFAAPIVAAAIAREINPNRTAQQAVADLLNQPTEDGCYGVTVDAGGAAAALAHA